MPFFRIAAFLLAWALTTAAVVGFVLAVRDRRQQVSWWWKFTSVVLAAALLLAAAREPVIRLLFRLGL